jgi:hypothetical protein
LIAYWSLALGFEWVLVIETPLQNPNLLQPLLLTVPQKSLQAPFGDNPKGLAGLEGIEIALGRSPDLIAEELGNICFFHPAFL